MISYIGVEKKLYLSEKKNRVFPINLNLFHIEMAVQVLLGNALIIAVKIFVKFLSIYTM